MRSRLHSADNPIFQFFTIADGKAVCNKCSLSLVYKDHRRYGSSLIKHLKKPNHLEEFNCYKDLRLMKMNSLMNDYAAKSSFYFPIDNNHQYNYIQQ